MWAVCCSSELLQQELGQACMSYQPEDRPTLRDVLDVLYLASSEQQVQQWAEQLAKPLSSTTLQQWLWAAAESSLRGCGQQAASPALAAATWGQASVRSAGAVGTVGRQQAFQQKAVSAATALVSMDGPFCTLVLCQGSFCGLSSGNAASVRSGGAVGTVPAGSKPSYQKAVPAATALISMGGALLYFLIVLGILATCEVAQRAASSSHSGMRD